MKNPPKNQASMDAKLGKWIAKKVVTGAMKNIKKSCSAADWNVILDDLWTPVRFDACGFSKP